VGHAKILGATSCEYARVGGKAGATPREYTGGMFGIVDADAVRAAHTLRVEKPPARRAIKALGHRVDGRGV
jgi:hypothetical protein